MWFNTNAVSLFVVKNVDFDRSPLKVMNLKLQGLSLVKILSIYVAYEFR